MAVKLKIGEEPIKNVINYSVQEDSTPVNPGDENGGTSQVNLTMPTPEKWRSTRGKSIELSDSSQGITSGKVATLSEKGGNLSITANSRILDMNVTRTAQPFVGNLRDAITYYLGLVGITDGIVIEEGLELVSVVFPGWIDNVYQKIARGLCPAWQLEMSLVSNNIVFRSYRQRKAVLQRFTDDPTLTIDDNGLAQGTRTTWYNTRYVSQSLVYPFGGWNKDVEVFDVNYNEIKVWEDIEIPVSLMSIVQPTCVTNVAPEYNAASVYTVAGSDGLPIPPQMWADFGGSLKLEINEDTKSLKLTVKGMDLSEYAPYTIGVASGPSTYYSSLRILGTGVELNQTELVHSTGLDADEAPDEFATDVDNVFIISKNQAEYSAGWQMAAAGGPARTFSFEASGINRVSDNGSYAYATFQDFDEAYAGMTFAQFDALWAGQDGNDWEEYWTEAKATEFSNQAFGNVAGARVYWDGSIYRIRSATNESGKLSAQAELDNTTGDFDQFYDGMTFEDFDKMWAGQTFDDFDGVPFPGIR